jgi:hypothetical protein
MLASMTTRENAVTLLIATTGIDEFIKLSRIIEFGSFAVLATSYRQAAIQTKLIFTDHVLDQGVPQRLSAPVTKVFVCLVCSEGS